MKRSDAFAGSMVWLSTASAAFAAALIALLGVAFERQSHAVAEQAARAEVTDALAVARAKVRGRLDANVQLIQGFAVALGAEPGIGHAAFERLAARLVDARSETRVIGVAPDMRIAMIYPRAGNEAAIGLDLRRQPEQLRSAELARVTGSTIVDGPVPLAQGGEGFIVRAPVARYDAASGGFEFWGLVSAVLDPAALYAESGLLDPDLGLDIVLSRATQGGGPEAPFFGDPVVLERDPVKARITFPYGSWSIAATPAGGWKPPPADWGARALFALAAVAVAGPLLALARLDASRRARLDLIRDREAELSQLSWRLEFALAASEVGVWDVDLATDELIWDERTRTLFGRADSAGPFGTADWEGAVHPEDRARAVAQADAAAMGASKFATGYRVLRPDGTVRHIRDVAALYEGEDGTRRLVGLVWDVTADVERQAELELRRAEAEAATVAKSRFLAAMSHEIRTPMGGVLGVLGLMLADQLTPRQRERAEIAMRSAEGLLRLLNDVLDFSKLEAGKVQPAEEAADLRQIVGEVVQLMAAGAEERGIAIGWTADPAVPERVVTDPMRLRQVLTNLVSNATKFTEAGSVEVRLDWEADPDASPPGGGTLAVAVSDTGIGVPEADRERIFGHFEQADSSLSRKAGGSGLGLAISRRLVELMGGRIEALGRDGGGSVFRFWIRARDAGAAAATTPAPVAAPPPRLGGVPPMRVLVAEDNPTNQYLINAFLAAMGHEAETVGSGAEAVRRAAGGGFDAVLMDVQMPDMDGLAATREIRAMPAPEGAVPIIALTANALPGDRELCLAEGMTDYLTKPLAAEALRAALARVAATGGAAAGAAPGAAPQRGAA